MKATSFFGLGFGLFFARFVSVHRLHWLFIGLSCWVVGVSGFSSFSAWAQPLKMDQGEHFQGPKLTAANTTKQPNEAEQLSANLPIDQVPQSGLRLSLILKELVDPVWAKEAPVFLFAKELRAEQDEHASFSGDVEFRRVNVILKSNKLEYFQSQDRIVSAGKVRFNQLGNVFEGRDLDLKVEKLEGVMYDASFSILRTSGQGKAKRLDFLGDKRIRASKVSYTTCTPEDLPGWMPGWVLQAHEMVLDENDDIGEAKEASLRFQDVAILSVPYLTFPLSDKRKSGLLPPQLNVDSVSGVEFGVPYYWNIAPNRDMTLYPNFMSRRGLDLGAEFRYLEPNHRGSIKTEWMPHDRLYVSNNGSDGQRWSYATQHNMVFNDNWLKSGRWGGELKLNRVSDDDYWKDFPRTIGSLTQRLLPSDAGIFWQSPEANASLRVRRWQTLQDVSAPITPPYDKLPEIILRYPRKNWAGLELGAEVSYTRFFSDPSLTSQVNGARTYLQTSTSKRFGNASWYVTPKMGVHVTQYQFDAALSDGRTEAQRALPSFSLDSGLFFDRDTTLQGVSYRQTLEPRAMLVHTPYRDQSLLPNYDSAAKDFNFSSIYSESPYLGNDRIADAQLLTMGVTSRFVDSSTGAERARIGIAQRYRLQDQKVTLPGQDVIQERYSDVLVGGALQWNSQFSSEQTVQYNPRVADFERAAISLRYKPGNYKTFNMSYFLQREASSQLDLSWQMPLHRSSTENTPGWYSSGRLNYSLRDQKMINGLLGFEYDACCWIGRVAVEHLQTSDTTATTRLLLQIEFVGFSRVGSNALRTFKDNVPRYQVVRERIETPSRFSQFD
jgi:LPS-assembly protein